MNSKVVSSYKISSDGWRYSFESCKMSKAMYTNDISTGADMSGTFQRGCTGLGIVEAPIGTVSYGCAMASNHEEVMC